MPQRTRSDIKDKVAGLVAELGEAHKQLRALNSKLEEIEAEAGEADLERVKLSLRAAYVKISQAGSKLVEAHADMTISPTAYQSD